MSLFIGKWDTANRFLTVEQHLIDTASAMRYLLKRNVTEQTVNASNLSRKELLPKIEKKEKEEVKETEE